MAAKLTILSRSAIPTNTKVSTASEEILRRLKRSSTALGQDEIEEILINYMDELAGMGFTMEWRQKVLRSSLLGYRRILFKATKGSRRNSLGECTRLKRRVQKLCGPSTWFKMTTPQEETREPGKRKGRSSVPEIKVGGKKPVEGVMFVPNTEGGVLKKQLQEAETNLVGYGQVRYQEMSGRTIESMLVVKDPWAGTCGRSDCFPCTTGSTGQCM